MKRWLFYISLAWRDIVRLWAATQHQVVIVTGICLPVLLLLGLKRGHVAELREELVTSASGRQVICWSAQRGELLGKDALDRLRSRLTSVELIVPEAQRTVRIDAVTEADAGDPASDGDENLVTLYSTEVGDPILKQYSADVLRPGERAVVLSEHVAKRMHAEVGDDVVLTVSRAGEEESHSFRVEIKALIPSQGESRSGYAHVELLAQIEQYVRGYAVAELDLPAMRGLIPPDEYESYLLFCLDGPGSTLTDADLEFLADRGIHCQEVDDEGLKSLHGLLKTEALDDLRVYLLTQGAAEAAERSSLQASPMLIVETTDAIDDFAMRWNPPTTVHIDGKTVELVGLSLPTVSQTGGWLLEYLVDPACGFDFETSDGKPFQIDFLGTPPAEMGETVVVEVDGGMQVSLAVRNSESAEVDGDGENTEEEMTEPAGDAPLRAVVPANLLAWIRQASAGELAYDASSGVFTKAPDPIMYDKARLYTWTIDEVPEVVAGLSNAGYAVLSESNRIAEIHDQDRSLEALVVVVGLGVFFFGTVTVVGVLVDATDRKRGAIGILRVMGMSRLGIFFVVVMRALIVGVLAAALSVCLGAAAAWAMSTMSGRTLSLPWKSAPSYELPRVSILFDTVDYVAIALGALLCSGLGAVAPAWRASAIDPFDAIVEGKFH